jgi:hypothetical protein
MMKLRWRSIRGLRSIIRVDEREAVRKSVYMRQFKIQSYTAGTHFRNMIVVRSRGFPPLVVPE